MCVFLRSTAYPPITITCLGKYNARLAYISFLLCPCSTIYPRALMFGVLQCIAVTEEVKSKIYCKLTCHLYSPIKEFSLSSLYSLQYPFQSVAYTKSQTYFTHRRLALSIRFWRCNHFISGLNIFYICRHRKMLTNDLFCLAMVCICTVF